MLTEPQYLIEALSEIQAISSPIRQEIVDTIQSLGECSIAEVAEELGRPADGLYYHIRALCTAGLIIELNKRKSYAREEAMYTTAGPGAVLAVKYDQQDPEKIQAINKMVQSMLKIAMQDFSQGMATENAESEGDTRNLWAARSKCWLTQKELIKANGLLTQLRDLFSSSRKASHSKQHLYALSWVLAPVEIMPKRRQ